MTRAVLKPLSRTLLRRPVWPCLGVALASLALLLAIGLLGLSGWFVTASGLAGLGMLVGLDIFTPGAGIRFFALGRTVARYGERLVNHEVTLRFLADLRVDLFQGLCRRSAGALGRLRKGDVLNRLTGDIDALDAFPIRVLVPGVAALASVSVLVVVLGMIAPPLAWIALIGCLLAGVALPVVAARLARRRGRGVTDAAAVLRRRSVDLVQGLADLRVYGRVERWTGNLAQSGRVLAGRQEALARSAAQGDAAASLAGGLVLWLVLAAGVSLLAAGALDGPLLALAVFAVMAGLEALAPLPAAFQTLGAVRRAAQRVAALDADPPEPATLSAPCPLPAGIGLCLRNVRFRYDDCQPAVLEGIDLDVTPGTRLGVTGPSGAGKSTLLALLVGLWRPTAGTIRMDGVDLARLDPVAFRARFAWLSQRPQLFNASVADNLRLARPDADDRLLWEALDQAGLADDVDAMPHGLGTMTGEFGTDLSGGQARRLALARAILRDAPIWLLDEPSEGLDLATETALLGRLAPVMAGRTVLMVSHRPSCLDAMEEIAVIDAGRIVSRQPRGVRLPGFAQADARESAEPLA
ncbi:thiol reductant ABC exporter subunit CydC [Marinivivus vitaminiproducens]|uniref:thiol reductant ABC exporter subunit CydC n=1 Tax=Marinivivus vitaminiproducens TaxID=3035935 RepID=UPI0027A788B3|nr:thiol reductant ABC exporter subunit CydC [Geminicoccaceae bacterium SCSIO 64248]